MTGDSAGWTRAMSPKLNCLKSVSECPNSVSVPNELKSNNCDGSELNQPYGNSLTPFLKPPFELAQSFVPTKAIGQTRSPESGPFSRFAKAYFISTSFCTTLRLPASRRAQ